MGRCPGTNTGTDGHSILGSYDEAVYLGLTTSHLVRLPNGVEMISRTISDALGDLPTPGDPVRLSWQADAIRLHTS
jgi:hypothetical protein